MAYFLFDNDIFSGSYIHSVFKAKKNLSPLMLEHGKVAKSFKDLEINRLTLILLMLQANLNDFHCRFKLNNFRTDECH